MEVINGRKARNRRDSNIETRVIGVRGEKQLWALCDKVAEREKMTRNELILIAIYEYCTIKDWDNTNGK